MGFEGVSVDAWFAVVGGPFSGGLRLGVWASLWEVLRFLAAWEAWEVGALPEMMLRSLSYSLYFEAMKRQ